MFIALGGTAYAATGGNFLLGKSNQANATTALEEHGFWSGAETDNEQDDYCGLTGAGTLIAP